MTYESRNGPKVVNVARGARQTVEMNKDESTDATQFGRFCQHAIEFGEKLAPRRHEAFLHLLSSHMKGVLASCPTADSNVPRPPSDSP